MSPEHGRWVHTAQLKPAATSSQHQPPAQKIMYFNDAHGSSCWLVRDGDMTGVLAGAAVGPPAHRGPPARPRAAAEAVRAGGQLLTAGRAWPGRRGGTGRPSQSGPAAGGGAAQEQPQAGSRHRPPAGRGHQVGTRFILHRVMQTRCEAVNIYPV